MKKTTLYIGSWLILTILLFFPMYAWLSSSGSPVYDYETVTETQPRVYVTNYGDKYHNGACQYLHSSRNAMGRTQAYDEGYTACSECGGRPSGTITVTYEKRIEKDPTARNVWGGIGLSVLMALIPAIMFASWFEEKYLVEETPSTPTPKKDTTQPPPPPPKPKTEREEMMDWYNNLNDYALEGYKNRPVIHKTFGIGYITRIIDRKYVEVWFDDLKDFKKFVFPDAIVDKYIEFYYR